jgi:hypothetical protein
MILDIKIAAFQRDFERLMPDLRAILAVFMNYFLEKKPCLIILGGHKIKSVFFIDVCCFTKVKELRNCLRYYYLKEKRPFIQLKATQRASKIRQQK